MSNASPLRGTDPRWSNERTNERTRRREIVEEEIAATGGALAGDPDFPNDGVLYLYVATTYCAVLGALALGALALAVALKWATMGRRARGDHLWDADSYCQRWQLSIAFDEVSRGASHVDLVSQPLREVTVKNGATRSTRSSRRRASGASATSTRARSAYCRSACAHKRFTPPARCQRDLRAKPRQRREGSRLRVVVVRVRELVRTFTLAPSVDRASPPDFFESGGFDRWRERRSERIRPRAASRGVLNEPRRPSALPPHPREGSVYLVWYFRALGARIGRDVCLYPTGASPMMTEPDLVTLGDRAAVDFASLVCHLNSRGAAQPGFFLLLSPSLSPRRRARPADGAISDSGQAV